MSQGMGSHAARVSDVGSHFARVYRGLVTDWLLANAEIRRALVRIFSFSILCCLVVSSAYAATVVGATPGSLSVSESGAATYSMPIAVTPGTVGMEPKLSLNYSSQADNGLVGVGWSLSGLSSITRCPLTWVRDGMTRNVQYDAQDRFCLDGQRLIAVAGTYGADATTYRTEIDSFTKVVSYGVAGTGPAYFKAWTKSGQIIEFGNTANSAIVAQGKPTVAVWAVNKISDTNANYMSVSYTQDTVNGQFYPIRIDYTGNSATGLAPYNSVQFDYETRPDVSISWKVGSKATQSVRLKGIRTYAGTAVTRAYRLAFETGTATSKSRLISVTECDSDQASANCVSPTVFAWQEGTPGFAAPINTGMPNAAYQYAVAIDVNGDGKTDLVYPSGTTWKVRLSQGATFSAEIDTGIVSTGYQYARAIDFNGDGLIDLLVPYANAHWYVMRATGNPLAPFAIPVDTGIGDGGKTGNPQVLDLNGDGLPDLVHAHDSYWYSALGNGTGFGADTQSPLTYIQGGYGYYAFDWARAEDFQADGKADVIIPRLYQNYLCGGFSICEDVRWDILSLNAGVLTNTPTNIPAYLYSSVGGSGVISVQRSQQAIDINADGNTDLLTQGANAANTAADWYLCQNWGADLAHCTDTTFGAISGQIMLQTDWDGDGKPDMLVAPNANGHWNIFKSNTSGTGMTLVDSGIPQAGYDANPLTGDFNGDGQQDLMLAYGGVWNLFLHNGNVPDRMLSVTDGLGQSSHISYKPMTDPTVYTKGSGAVFPDMESQNASLLVSGVSTDDGIGGQFVTTYTYGGARTNLQGRGSLGFRYFQTRDAQTGISSLTEYRQDFPYIGLPTRVTKTSSTSVILAQVDNTYASIAIPGGGQFPYLAYSKAQRTDLDGSVLPFTETWNENYDNWGNVGKVTTKTSDNYTTVAVNTYTNDATNWLLGRLSRAVVTKTTPSGWALTRTSAFAYNPTTGLLTQEVIEPDQAAFTLITDYLYDAYGNKTKATVSGGDATAGTAIAARSTTTTYDAQGRFALTTANALGHTETHVFDPRFGLMTSLTGPNSLTTSWIYDGFGRKTLETRADTTQTSWVWTGCVSGCPTYAKYTTTEQSSGATPVTTYFDALKRPVRVVTSGFDGRAIYADTQYDNQGRVKQSSRPYYAADPAYWIVPTYDVLGRAVRTDNPDSSFSTMAYHGLTTVATNELGQIKTETKNGLGQTISITDAMAGVTTYAYTPFGQVQYVASPGGGFVLNSYDPRGRKIFSYDADMSVWNYKYDTLGELIYQNDAKQQGTTMKYDVLGRMIQRIEPDYTSLWTYDTANKGIGKLALSFAGGLTRWSYYDQYGRNYTNVALAQTIALYTVTNFDAFGRIDTTAYPSGFISKNVYNAQGYLSELHNGDASNALFWRADKMDAEGHVTQETYGNGVTTQRGYDATTGRMQNVTATLGTQQIQGQGFAYDSLGNTWLRGDGQTGTSEFFQYDALNRLTNVNRYLNGVNSTDTLSYNAAGNITSKSGVGSYTYGDSAHQHAATQAGTNSYTYDANGNLTAGGGRSVTWTGWNMPFSLTEFGQTTWWNYGPDHERYIMTTPGRTTYYLNPRIDLGGHYEQTQYSSGTIEYRHTLYAAGSAIGEVITYGGSTPPPAQTRYYHNDNQGTITAVTDASGVVLSRYRYDAWGKQTLVSGANAGLAATRQGYTGQEMLDGGLVHLNGRLYDPVLSRFVSADPVIQDATDGQSYNRYSYVLNNPLYYTDPSGYDVFSMDSSSSGSSSGSSGGSGFSFGFSFGGGSGGGSSFGGGGGGSSVAVFDPGAGGKGMNQGSLGSSGVYTNLFSAANIDATQGAKSGQGKVANDKFAGGQKTGAYARLFTRGDLGNTYDRNNVMGGFDAYGNSAVYSPSYYNPSAFAACLVCVAGMIIQPEADIVAVVNLSLKYKVGWTAAQQAEAAAKAEVLTVSRTVVTKSERAGTAAAMSRYRRAEQVGAGRDVDHMVDLQLGGSKAAENLWSLDSSVNRSLGAQIQQQIKNLPPGTVIDRVMIGH